MRGGGNNFDLFSIFWQPNSALKMFICLLRAILNKLLTRDKLTSFGVIDIHLCPLCLVGHESRDLQV